MITVIWTLLFTPSFGTTMEQLRSAKLKTPAAAQLFIEHAPKESFECIDLSQGQNGTCFVKEIWIQKR
jgi:hypothetical protein